MSPWVGSFLWEACGLGPPALEMPLLQLADDCGSHFTSSQSRNSHRQHVWTAEAAYVGVEQYRTRPGPDDFV